MQNIKDTVISLCVVDTGTNLNLLDTVRHLVSGSVDNEV